MNAPQHLEAKPLEKRFYLYIEEAKRESGATEGTDEKSERTKPLSIELKGDDPWPDDVNRWTKEQTVDIVFASYQDGRGYSLAQRLREVGHFEGELRAVGDIRPDQVHYLVRSGFNSVVVREKNQIDQFRVELSRYRAFYRGVESESWSPHVILEER